MRRHIGLVIGVIAAVLVLSAAATYVIAGDYLVNNFMLMTKSDEGYFRWLSSKQIKRAADRISRGETAVQKAGIIGGDEENRQKGTAGSVSYKLSLTDEFCDTIGIYTLHDPEIRLSYTADNSEFGFELTPVYRGQELLTLRSAGDFKAGKFYAQIPTYREDVIDLSALLDTPLQDGKKLKDYLGSVVNGEGTLTALRDEDDDSLADLFREYAEYLVDSAEDVEIKKKQPLSLGDEEVKVAHVTVSYDSKELKSLLKGLADMLMDDGVIGTAGIVKAKDIDGLIESVDPSAKLTFTEYVNGKGRVEGGELEFSLNSAEFSAEFVTYKDGSDTVSTLKVSVGGITLVTFRITDSSDDDDRDISVEAKPGAFVRTAFKDYAGYTLNIRYKGKEKSGTCSFGLMDSGRELASFTIKSEFGKYKEPILTTEGKKVYDITTIDESPYLDLPKLIDLALSIIDRVDEPFVNDMINDALAGTMGSEFTIDTIREYNEQGMFDMFGGSEDEPGTPEGDPGDDRSDAGGETTVPDDASSQDDDGTTEIARIPGIISPDPADYEPTKWTYPQAGEIYRYSHAELAPFAKPGQYKGLEYVVPKAGDVTPEAFEQGKKDLLDNCRGVYTEDENKISVQMGDEIYFDIVPIMGGYAITAYTFEDCYALIGEYTYGEGLDDMVIGMKVGEVRDLDITLGDMYGDFAGFTGTFRLTLKHIFRYIEPSWTEDFICGVLGYDSLDACSDEIMSGLRGHVDVSETEIATALESIAFSNTSFGNISEDVYNSLRQEYYDNMYDVTCEFGQRPEEYFAAAGYSLDDFIGMMDSDIDSDIKLYCFYAAIAEAEDIYLTGEEAAELADSYIEYYEAEDFDDLMSYLPLDTLIDYEIISRIHRILYESAVVKY